MALLDAPETAHAAPRSPSRCTLASLTAIAPARRATAKTLRWAGRGDMQTTDPHSQNENLTNNINLLIYEFLVDRDKKLGLRAALAESWKQVDPTTWRFKLRPGVKFHDGTPFTADDVVFSFERAPRRHLAAARLRQRRPASRRRSTTSPSSSRPTAPTRSSSSTSPRSTS